jgi:TonB family protein
MTASLLVRRAPPMKKFLIGSVVGHGSLMAVVLVAHGIMGPKMVDLDQKPIHASLVRKGKPRDEKLLPRKEPEAAPPAPPKAAEIPIPGVKPEKAPATPHSDKGSPDDSRKKLFNAFGKVGAQAPKEELEGQEDGDPNGDAAQAEGERYHAMLKQRISRLYDVSNTIPESERIRLTTQVLMFIGKTGELIDVKFARGSGNDLFDNAVMAAVKKAAPFGPPPEHLRDSLAQDGIVIVFKP